MRRPRGPGGRFLTADEVAAMEKDAKGDENGENKIDLATPVSGKKRKAQSDSSDTPAKKSKVSSDSAEDDDDGDGEED